MPLLAAILPTLILSFHPSSGCIATQSPEDDMWEPPGTTSMIMTLARDPTTTYEDPPWMTSLASDAPTSTTVPTTTSETTTTTTSATTTTTTTTVTTTPYTICPSMWTWFMYNNMCYTVVQPPSNGMTPEMRCNAFFTGSHAASVADMIVNSQIRSYVSATGGLLGGVSPTPGTPGSPSWSWTDMTTYSYENWNGGGFPMNDLSRGCIFMYPDGTWSNVQCTDFSTPVVCQLPSIAG